MIDKLSPDLCCGCSVCHDVCPKSAIEMVPDIEGFKHPKINSDDCIGCNLCEKVCPVINADKAPRAEWESPECYAANHKSYEVRFRSTSGGVFSALADTIYKEGGYVGGAASGSGGELRQVISNKPEDLTKLRRSKYKQSDAQGYYAEIKRLLTAGEQVLAVGTPCMIAGLNQFLKKDYPNLVTADFVCNNVLSPVIARHLKEYEERKMGSKMVYTHSKDKEISWHALTNRYDFRNGKSIYVKGRDGGDGFGNRVYHAHLAGRPSCSNCPFKGYPRYADISLGDYWGVEKHHPALFDDIGTSLVMVNSAKGKALFEKVKSRLILEDSRKEWIEEGNPSIHHACAKAEIDRKAFFEALTAGGHIEDVVEKVLPQPPQRLGRRAKLRELLKTMRKSWCRLKRITQLRPVPLCQFVYLNFFHKGIHSNWKKGYFLFPTPYSVFEISPKANVILDGVLTMDPRKFRHTKVETRLLVEENATLHAKGFFSFGYGADVEIFRDAVLEVEDGGANFNLALICAKHIEMRGTVMIGRDVSIRDTNAHIIALDGYKVTAPVVIENHTWLCSGCNINPGSKVGVGSIVGGMANLSGRVPAHCLAVGNPAKVVMKDIMWKY